MSASEVLNPKTQLQTKPNLPKTKPSPPSQQNNHLITSKSNCNPKPYQKKIFRPKMGRKTL